MGINSSHYVSVNWPMADSYNRNATLTSSALLLKRKAHRLAFELRRRSNWGSRLDWDADQVVIHVWVEMRLWWGPRLSWNTDLKSASELKRWTGWDPRLSWKVEIHVCIKTRPSCWNEVRVQELVFSDFYTVYTMALAKSDFLELHFRLRFDSSFVFVMNFPWGIISLLSNLFVSSQVARDSARVCVPNTYYQTVNPMLTRE